MDFSVVSVLLADAGSATASKEGMLLMMKSRTHKEKIIAKSVSEVELNMS